MLNLRQQGKSMRAIARLTGHGKNSVKAWLRGEVALPDDLGQDQIYSSAALRRDDDVSPLPSAPEGWTSWEEDRNFKAELKAHGHVLSPPEGTNTPPRC